MKAQRRLSHLLFPTNGNTEYDAKYDLRIRAYLHRFDHSRLRVGRLLVGRLVLVPYRYLGQKVQTGWVVVRSE